ncbi:hypothetical protein BDV27DRAFT_123525 [Aspergillus caelatus]|uniref:UBC core domain-containing protein n=1 Tax=Aspergillus caelatus TaxID=61420 RepID=A0A5N7ACW4_9EURO|nr:uncharacterized protein BDV27DRAFT_123525 [Aspergillus caelatus]KAE8367707.1 hypothetical protein BDV27DRAFT_123525 [Aspergillus caelatus]
MNGLTNEPTRIGGKKDTKFDVDDACCLKSNPTLVGHVCRTDHDADDDEPLSLNECLILSYTTVPQKDLEQFLETGVPPKGYAFVSFTEPSQGNSLIHENDLELLDRTFDLGDTVKRHPDDTISGTVISTSATCSLEPIAYRAFDPETGEYGSLNFTEKVIKREGSLATENDATEPPLLHGIPVVELKKYEEFSEGDYIVYRQKLGIIHGIDRDAILLLPNQSVISPLDPSALEIPFSFGAESLVTLPSNMSATRYYPSASGGTIWSTESSFLFPGQFSFTSRNNLSRGDLSSSAASMSQPEGYVLATPAMDIQVDWLCPNVFAPGTSHSGGANIEVLRASTLRGNAMVCDFGQVSRGNPDKKPVHSDSWLNIGDRVRFRDSISAAVKYPAYQHLPTDQTFGQDINILRVTSMKTEITIQWQDGTITTEAATSLLKFLGVEDEVWPGNLVVLKDGIEIIREPCKNNTGPLGRHMRETLHVRRVGVIQNVDSRERIASVRWYKDPDVKVTHQGNMLVPGSFLGELSDAVTEVSIYELYSYPSMQRTLNDLVLLAPGIIHRSSIPAIDNEPTRAAGPCRLSSLSPVSFSQTLSYLESMKLSMVNFEWFKRTTEIDTSPVPSKYSVHHEEFSIKSPTNFIGKIISIDTEGTITIRTVGADNVRDIRVPWERIMMIIDEDNIIPPVPLPPLELLSLAAIDRFEQSDDFPFTETIEYEGGARLDNDSGDDDWATEGESELDYEEFEEVENDSDDNDGLMAPALSIINPPERLDHDEREQPGTDETGAEVSRVENRSPMLSLALPSSCPPGFSMLESSPPSDHHFFSTVPSEAPGLRIKRIQKEFEILQSSLPTGIFVRTWESRMDLLRVLIIGPQGTPYEHAPFVIDFHFPDDFPTRPPAAYFHSWTDRTGMINPNLGENGNICLSLLGTWPGKNPTESWSPTNSTVLQILVSIMGLVLVKMPFYNEAGYETLAAEEDRRVESTQYTEKAFLITRTFIQHALANPIAGLEDVLAWHYFADPQQKHNDTCIRPQLLRRAIDEALNMIEHHNRTPAGAKLSEEHAASAFVSRLSLGAVVMLRKHVTTLENIELVANSLERV